MLRAESQNWLVISLAKTIKTKRVSYIFRIWFATSE